MGAENAETGALLNSPLHQRHRSRREVRALQRLVHALGVLGCWGARRARGGSQCRRDLRRQPSRQGDRRRSRRGGLRQPLSAADLRKIGPGRAQYTLLCNADGGVVDDMIAYLKSPDEVFLIPNAANCGRWSRCWLRRRLRVSQ